MNHYDAMDRMEKELEQEAKGEQIGGSHYKDLKIQPIDFILENNLGFCEGNVVKYTARHKEKNGAEDIRKAIQYLQFILADQYQER